MTEEQPTFRDFSQPRVKEPGQDKIEADYYFGDIHKQIELLKKYPWESENQFESAVRKCAKRIKKFYKIPNREKSDAV